MNSSLFAVFYAGNVTGIFSFCLSDSVMQNLLFLLHSFTHRMLSTPTNDCRFFQNMYLESSKKLNLFNVFFIHFCKFAIQTLVVFLITSSKMELLTVRELSES
uniref:Uncharacterized protein n=1 Tax=Octopus bimaculoides TaxID=37653 RepID=A0A0L8IDK1_OCTBM